MTCLFVINEICHILDPEIVLQVTPSEIVGLEASCPESMAYRNITVVCTATKPLQVVPELSIGWTFNGVSQNTEGVSLRSGSTKTRVLTLTEIDSSRAGSYMCTASISPPESPTVTESRSSTVYYRGL